MKTNSLLTYLLYALLVALISVACYKACQMKKEKAEKAQEEAELQKTLRDMGYASDSTATSTYTNGSDSSSTYTTPSPDANGIVDAPTTTKTTKPATTTTTTKSVTTQPAKTTTLTTVKTTSTPGAGLTAKSGVSKVKGPGTGKYSVRAGTFSSKERARSQLESVIKMGYQTAEVSATKNGYWTVLIMRTNDRAKAVKMVDQLVAKGVDAALF
ncbi:MAG: SPOR domain-containing protein [Saprospiraceae bacterium]